MPKKAKAMNKKDIAFFKKLLVKQKLELFNGMSGITNDILRKSLRDASGDLSGYSYHMADVASDVYERDFLLQLASGEREFFFKIEEALRRMADGEYGICQRCGKRIAKARQKAVPHARCCHGCQEKEEKGK